MINTVPDNKADYKNRTYARAVMARNIVKMVRRPTTKEFVNIVEMNLLPICPVIRDDILISKRIFGPDVGSLKGKTVGCGTDHVEVAVVPVSSEIISQYRDVIIVADIMFVNKLPFFVTISRNIKFGTTALIPNQKHETLVKAARDVQNINKKRGFTTGAMLMDGQFEGISGDLAELRITLNTVARGEHVPEAEQYIRTTKERAFLRIQRDAVYQNVWKNGGRVDLLLCVWVEFLPSTGRCVKHPKPTCDRNGLAH